MSPELKMKMAELTDDELDDVVNHVVDLRKIRRHIKDTQMIIDSNSKKMQHKKSQLYLLTGEN